MSLTESDRQAPRLLVFAGPNGSGKSTVTVKLPTVGLYVNADDIRRARGCTDLEAAQEAERIRNLLLESGKSFTFETVLSTPRNLELIRRAKEVGYEVMAVFVLTKDPAINVERVRQRTAAGGHDVPEDKIVSRYYKSLKNLPVLVRMADRTRIIDNSADLPELICEVTGDRVQVIEGTHWKKGEILALLAKEPLAAE
ncbi:MAG: zeta toxin family protein [Lachnospiraceae bacterium]|nr:zeta toxin family protein [Lachnospiraceae bacterium]